jgi:ATP-binding cassette, subfamily B, bacterial
MLEIRNLTCLYPGTNSGVSGINLTLKRGTLTVITGPIGAGKTTLLRAVLGLLPLNEGQLLWNGQVISDLASFMLPPRSAYTAQVPRLFSESLRQNILLGLPPDETALNRALHAAVLDHDVTELARGLDTLIGPKGVKLSGGQVQRAAAARMFIRRAELLVLDDLSSALDVETEQTMWSRLFVGNDQTVLAVSHRPVALQRADQVIVLDNGQMQR